MTLYNKYGGAEACFSYSPSDSRAVTLTCSALGLAQAEATSDFWWVNQELTRKISLSVSSQESASTSVICRTMINSVVIDQSACSLGSALVSSLRCKIILATNAISVYCNDLWIYTYVFRDVAWPEVPELFLDRSEIFEITDIKRIELSDRREAVYIDYEATADSAVQSVIQQRPVQIFPEVERANAYTYSAIRGIVSAHHVNQYEETTRDNQQLASDGLVYYVDTGISISKPTAKAVGLITRLYRLSELDNGALESAARIQKLALERRKMVTISMRLDPRIEIADNLLLDLILSGTGTRLTDSLIVEDISISMQNGNYQMQISARRSYGTG